MILKKCKFIIYALVTFSLSVAIGLYAEYDDARKVFVEYFIPTGDISIKPFSEYPLKSFFLLKDKPVNPVKSDGIENEIIDIEHKKEIFLSEDSEFAFDCQKSSNLAFYNQTDYTIDSQSLLVEIPDLNFANNEMPQILIVHTHASESYGYQRDYELMDTDRTQDKNFNMIRVGEELKKELEQRGYNVLHDETIHDYPSYTSSYQRTGQTIEAYLKKYPSIVAVFDLHRDAIVNSQGKSVGFVSEINGEECAQIMIVCGTDKNNLKFDLWEENLRFAFKIQDYMEKNYPGVMRPLNIRKERFNLHLTKGSLLFEIGTNGNSLKQAISSIKYLADGIDNVCNSLK